MQAEAIILSIAENVPCNHVGNTYNVRFFVLSLNIITFYVFFKSETA